MTGEHRQTKRRRGRAAAAAAAGALGVLALCGGAAARPEFCREGDCPTFEALPAGEGYEARRYGATEWSSVEEGRQSGFMSLFRYISGENAEERRIPMTTPVLMTSYLDGGAADRMSFWIAKEDQPGPTPIEEGVTVGEWPAMDVFVISYGGWSSSEREERYADRLKGMLDRDGRQYNNSVVFSAGYDSPMTFFGRHNEVWLLSLGDSPVSVAAGELSTSAVEGGLVDENLLNATTLEELTGSAENSTLQE